MTENPAREAAQAYGDAVNAPLRPETIAALNGMLARNEVPRRRVSRRQDEAPPEPDPRTRAAAAQMREERQTRA